MVGWILLCREHDARECAPSATACTARAHTHTHTHTHTLLDHTHIAICGGVGAGQVSVSVSPGWHTFKWIYSKDMSQTQGQDAAEVLEIGYNGTAFAATTCSKCAEGYTSQAGAWRRFHCGRDL